MKAQFPALLVMLCIWCISLPGQMVSHSHHDFGGNNWDVQANCSPCHVTLEESKSNVDLAWIKNAEGSYEVYSDSEKGGHPGSVSKLCLTCHDGTIGMESHASIGFTKRYTKEGQPILEKVNNHPVSIPYNYKTLPGKTASLNNPYTTRSGLGSSIYEDLLKNGKVECTSCHDIHLTGNSAGCLGCHTDGVDKPTTIKLSLWIPDNVSALCLTCHIR